MVRHSGHHWEMEIVDNVAVARFQSPEAFTDVESIIEAHKKQIRHDRVSAHVGCLQFEEAAGQEMLEGAAKAAKMGAEHGVTRWAVACPSIGKLAVKNQIRDVPTVEAEAFDSEQPAVDWAKET